LARYPLPDRLKIPADSSLEQAGEERTQCLPDITKFIIYHKEHKENQALQFFFVSFVFFVVDFTNIHHKVTKALSTFLFSLCVLRVLRGKSINHNAGVSRSFLDFFYCSIQACPFASPFQGDPAPNLQLIKSDGVKWLACNAKYSDDGPPGSSVNLVVNHR